MNWKKILIFSGLAILVEQTNIYLFQGDTIGGPETFPHRHFYDLLYTYVGLYKANSFAGILSYIFWLMILLLGYKIIKFILKKRT